jgi:hypothetical protein
VEAYSAVVRQPILHPALEVHLVVVCSALQLLPPQVSLLPLLEVRKVVPKAVLLLVLLVEAVLL